MSSIFSEPLRQALFGFEMPGFNTITRQAKRASTKVMEFAKNHQWITLMGATFAIGSAGFFYYRHYNSLSVSSKRLVVDCDSLGQIQIQGRRNAVTRFVNSNFYKLNLPRSCSNIENARYLNNKIIGLIEQNRSTQQKQEVLINILQNFSSYLRESTVLIANDLINDQLLRDRLQIIGNPRLRKITILGDESHQRRNNGSNPLLIETEEPILEIIFKPRSMISEELLCNINDSVFSRLFLPTYPVYNKQVERPYGYSDRLNNLRDENVFDTEGEVRGLLLEHGKIEKVVRLFGVSDLHFENVFMSQGRPKLIDTEVILIPNNNPVYSTHYLVAGHSSGALGAKDGTSNHIWTNALNETHSEPQELCDGLDPLLHHLGLSEYGQCMIDQNHEDLSTFVTAPADVEVVREQLGLHRHRIVLVSTATLVNIIEEELPTARDRFLIQVTIGIMQHGFYVDENQLHLSLEQFELDLKNNDVPIFYHHNEIIYYGSYQIATFQPFNVIW